MQKSSRTALAAMVFVLLVASLFYLYELNSISFWEDESWMAIAIGDGLADVWTFATNRGVHPPLYFYLAYVLEPFISSDEYALRWMGGLVTLAGIALTYQLGLQISKDWRVGVLAALLASGSIFLLYLTRLARHYTLFYTLSVWMYYLYWRWQARPDRRTLISMIFVQAAVLYTHYFGAFIAVAITAHAIITRPRQSWKVIAAFIGSGILFLPWLPSIWAQLNGDLGEGVYYGANKLKDIPGNYIGRITNANDWFGIGFGLAGLVALIRQKSWSFLLLLVLTIIGTFAVIVIINQTLFQWYVGRNMLYTLPLVVVFYGMGLIMLWRHWAGKVTVSLFVIAFIVYGVLAYPAFYPGTIDWRSLFRQVTADGRPSDTYVIRGEPYSTDYYLRQFYGTRSTVIRYDEWLGMPVTADRIWLVDPGQSVRDEALDHLPETMQRTRQYYHNPVIAELYQRVPDEPLAIFGEQMAVAHTDEPLIAIAGETLTVDMWWQATRTPDFNYSASVQLWGDNNLIAQVDGNFDSGRLDAQVLPVGIWVPDTRRIDIPQEIPAGDYQLRVTVYDWRDNTRLPVGSSEENDLALLATVTIRESE